MASGTTAADGTDWASVAILTLRFVAEIRVYVNRKVSYISFSADSGLILVRKPRRRTEICDSCAEPNGNVVLAASVS